MRLWRNSSRIRRRRSLIPSVNKFKRLKWEEGGTSGLERQLMVPLIYSKRSDLPRGPVVLKKWERKRLTSLNRRELMESWKESKLMMAPELMVLSVTWSSHPNIWSESYPHNSSRASSLTHLCPCQSVKNGILRRVTNALSKTMC